ncbi:MAG: sulfite exporter TauE/SafE family protein [Bacilli bacterium]
MTGIVLILLLCGIVAGTVGSLVGLGGGVIIVPVLLYLGSMSADFEVTPQIAVGTSLLVIAVSSLSSSIAYFRQRKVDVRSALLFFLASGPGAIVGAYVNTRMSGGSFLIGFGTFMIAVSFLLMMRGRWKKRDAVWSVTRTYHDAVTNEDITYGYTRKIALTVSFVVGVIAGMFGVGGGALMMPVMLLLFHYPVHVAAATSMFMIFLSSIPGSITHGLYGNIDLLFVVALAPGAWVGGQLGAYLSTKLKTRTLIICLRVMLILTGIRLIWTGIPEI